MQKILPVWIYLALAFVTVRCATPTTMTVQANATGFNNMGQFCPELDDGVNVTCLVDHGVGNGQMWMEPDGTSPSCVSYAYAQAGYQTIHLYCSVDNIFFYQNKTLYVGERIDQVTVGGQNGNSLIPLINSSDIYVTYVNGSDVSVEIFSNTSNMVLSQTNVTTTNSLHTITAADLNYQLGMHAVSVTLRNPISSVTRWLVVALDEVISGFIFTGHINPIMHIDDVIDLNFTLEKGSDLSIAIEINTVLFVQKCEGALRNHSFSYTLNETGSYIIELTLSNFVSTFNWTFPLTVQYPVHNFTVQQIKNVMKGTTDTWTIELPANSSTPMGNLFGVIEENGYQTENISLTTATSQTHSKTYLNASYFNITFTIQSEISQMVFSWIQVVENELKLELLNQESVPISQSEQEFVLRITDHTTSPLYKLNCTIDIDGVSEQFPIAEKFTYSTNQTFRYQYYGIGNKTVTVNCSNTLRNWTITKIVEVWTDCFASANFFSVAFKRSTTPMRVYITQIVQITAKVEVTQLCKNSSREYWWDFYDVPHDDHLNPELRGYYNDSANQPNGVTITFAKEAIEAGLKKLVLKVNLTDQEGGILEDFIYVDFRTPPIVAQITGGSEVSHEVSANLIMDASSSKDPVQLYSDQPFNFTWTCFKVPEANVSALNTFMGTFEPVNATSPSSLGADCSPTSTNQGRIEIPQTDLRDGFYFLFIVTVEKINQTSAGLTVRRNDKAFQAVHIVPYVPPKAELICLRNCNKKINLDSISSFNVTCSNCDSNTIYRWDLEVFNTTTNMFETMLNGGFEAYIETRTMETTEIAIKASVLPQGERLRLKCDISWNKKNATTVSNIMSVNYPPRGGECAIEPKTGDASITFFEIKCSGWLDEEDRNTMADAQDHNALLTYKVYQRTVRNGTRINSLLEESTEPIVKAYLGIGDPSNDYNSTIVVYVIDRFYGRAEYSIPVQVNNPIASTTLPSTGQVEEYYSTVLTELNKSNSAELLMRTVESITSVLTDFTIIKNDSYPDIEVNKLPTEWNDGLLDLQDVNGTKVMASYDSILDDILQKSVNAYQVKVQETLTNLTETMLSRLHGTNSSTFAWVETTSTAFGNVLTKSEYISDKSVIHAANALKQLTASFTNLTISQYSGDDSIFSSSSPAIEQATTGILNLMNSLVVNTVPDDIVSTSDATIASSSTASSRLYVEYLFLVNVDQAYEYAENSTLTPEERVGMFYMRSRISQIELEKKRKVSEESGRDLNDAIESLAASLLSVECNGCSHNYSKDSVVLRIQSDTVEAIYNTSWDSNLTLNFGDIPKDTVVKLATTEFNRNIYLYDHSTTAALITSPVQKITAEKMSIFVVTIKHPVTTNFSNVKVTVPTFISEDASGFFYHTFLYRNLGDYACFHIVQVPPKLNEKYDVYLRVADFPTIFQYDAIAEVSINRDYMACIPPQKINSVGIIHIGLKPTPAPSYSGRRKRAAGACIDLHVVIA